MDLDGKHLDGKRGPLGRVRPHYWLRWLTDHGVARVALRTQARRGDVFAELMGGPRGFDDPYPLIEQLRTSGPLVRAPLTYVTFDHKISRKMLRDSTFGIPPRQTFDSGNALDWFAKRFPLPPSPVEPPSMLVINPPEHTRMRKPVASAFTPRAITRLSERVESVTEQLLRELPAGGSVDLMKDFAAQVPIAIISEMLGFPNSDRNLFLAWGDRMTPLLDLGISWRTYRRALLAMEVMDGYLDEHIAHLRRSPGDDILSTLVSAGELDNRSLKATASLLMGAGFETTVNLIGNGVAQLLAHPDQLARLRAEPELWPNAIEEILRIDPPVQTTARIAHADTEIAGVPLGAGSVVILSLAGANRDPAVFDEPDRFDIARPNAKDHLSFSNGLHVCLGASLARMEGTYALRALFDNFPDLRLTEPPRRRKLFTLHGFEHMRVGLGRRSSVEAVAATH
ncbi:cytochrome P450 [Nocardia callitridis]|uniref:Cytochrome P450 n=1 Tax=Nocardia callitridis TaxID=648753 RepID=A0ABP9JQN8_9NOCA